MVTTRLAESIVCPFLKQAAPNSERSDKVSSVSIGAGLSKSCRSGASGRPERPMIWIVALQRWFPDLCGTLRAHLLLLSGVCTGERWPPERRAEREIPLDKQCHAATPDTGDAPYD